MFPKPRTTDPQSFQGLLQRHLVPEVRLETQAFYGHLLSQEAKYPGLDYSYPPHRIRLSRYPWHRRLFRAFDNLGLTKYEIAALTKWEGTRWAKERFEREQGIFIRDTTADCIGEWTPPHLRSQRSQPDMEQADNTRTGDGGLHTAYGEIVDPENDAPTVPVLENEADDSDSEMQSVGVELNERLRAAVAQREAGDYSASLDEAWEKWLHEHATSEDGPNVPGTTQTVLSSVHTSVLADLTDSGTRRVDPTPEHILFSRWLVYARAGQWHSIPEAMHSPIRQEINGLEQRITPITEAQRATSILSSSSPATFSTPARQSGSLMRSREDSREESRSTAVAVAQTSSVRDMSRSDLLTPPPENEPSSSVTMSRLLISRDSAINSSTRPSFPLSNQNLMSRNRTLRYSLLSHRRDPNAQN